jgi:hypothetical protein
MEDVVAVRVQDNTGKWFGFMTWGRLRDRLDETWVIEAVANVAKTCAMNGVGEARVCSSMHEVANCQYFYEALFQFSNAWVLPGKSYKGWHRKRLKELDKGFPTVYFLGPDLGCGCQPATQ